MTAGPPIDRAERGAWRRLWPLLALWLVPVAIVAVAFPLSLSREAESVSPAVPEFVTVGESTNDYRTAVVLDIGLSRSPQIRTQAAGLVTSVTPHGGTVVNGQQLLGVNNVPVVAFRSSSPLFRDLGRGDEGADVAQLETFLAELGLLEAEAVDAEFGWSTDAAVRTFQANLGVDDDGVFRLGYVAFIGSGVADLGEAQVVVGDSVGPGATIMAGAPVPLSLSIRTESDQATLEPFSEGPLVLRFGAIEVPLPALSMPSGDLPAVLAPVWEAVDAGVARAQQAEGGESSSISGGVISLAEGVSGAVVPTTAVLITAEGSRCVFAEAGAPGELVAHEVGDIQPAVGLIGSSFVSSSLVGLSIVRDAAALPGEVSSRCG